MNKASTPQLVTKLLFVVVGMFGFGYALVPLYDVICEVTGLNGKTGRLDAEVAQELVIDEDRWVTVEFVSNLSGGASSWDFKPEVRKMKVNPGKTYQVMYSATNLLRADRTSQAVPSMSPSAASRYFNKTECFCFTQQQFAAGEQREMPLIFVVDPGLPQYIQTVTLSYALFDVTPTEQGTTTQSEDYNNV